MSARFAEFAETAPGAGQQQQRQQQQQQPRQPYGAPPTPPRQPHSSAPDVMVTPGGGVYGNSTGRMESEAVGAAQWAGGGAAPSLNQQFQTLGGGGGQMGGGGGGPMMGGGGGGMAGLPLQQMGGGGGGGAPGMYGAGMPASLSPGMRQLVPGIGELAQLCQRLAPLCAMQRFDEPLLRSNGRPDTLAFFQVKKGMRKTLQWAPRRVAVGVGVGGWRMDFCKVVPASRRNPQAGSHLKPLRTVSRQRRSTR